MILLESDKFDEAKANIDILLNLDLHNEVRVMLSGLEVEDYIMKKDFITASEKVNALIDMDKDNPHAYFYKAQLLVEQNKINDALNEINICLEKAENGDMPIPHPDFYLLKSIILKELDDDEYIYYETKAKQLSSGLKGLFG